VSKQPNIASSAQRGVTLLELLVSMVILSLGVLSVVSLQLVAQRNNADAGAQSVASQLAYDVLGRMHMNSYNSTAPGANSTTLAQYITSAANGVGHAQQGTEPSPHCDASGTACTGTQMAAHDVWAFEQSLDGAAEVVSSTKTGGLLNPNACITGPATGSAGDAGVYTVTVVWRGKIPLVNNAAVTCASTSTILDTYYGTAGECQAATGNSSAGNGCYRRTLQVTAYIGTS
jgi:type IV pilus assembly protein PilV